MSYTWSTDTNYPTGSLPWSGTPTRVEPPAGYEQIGFTPSGSVPAQYLNYVLGQATDYVSGGLQSAYDRSVALGFDGSTNDLSQIYVNSNTDKIRFVVSSSATQYNSYALVENNKVSLFSTDDAANPTYESSVFANTFGTTETTKKYLTPGGPDYEEYSILQSGLSDGYIILRSKSFNGTSTTNSQLSLSKENMILSASSVGSIALKAPLIQATGSLVQTYTGATGNKATFGSGIVPGNSHTRILLETKNVASPGLNSYIDMYSGSLYMGSGHMYLSSPDITITGPINQAGAGATVQSAMVQTAGVGGETALIAGAWTPTASSITGGTGANVNDVTSQAGSYQRIGDQVHAKCSFSLDTTGWQSSTLYTVVISPPTGLTPLTTTMSPFAFYQDQTSTRFSKVQATRVAASLVIEVTTGSSFGTNNFFYEVSYSV